MWDRRAARRFSQLQWQTPEAVETLMRGRLQALIEYAGTHVPFYRTRLEKMGIPPRQFHVDRDWHAFPIVTKQELREAYPEGVVAAHLPEKRRISDRTSGSTGHPFLFFLDRRATPLRNGSRLFFDGWMGIELPWTKVMMRSGGDSGQGGGKRDRDWWWYAEYYRQRIWDRFGIGGRHVGQVVNILVLQVSSHNLGEVVQVMAQIQPDFLAAPPGRLRHIAQFILDSGDVGRIRPKAVVTVAETLTEDTRRILSDAFQCRVYNRYASRELGFLAQTCPDHPEALHVNSGVAFLEVINEQGLPCTPGETGRVIVTDLHNRVMPLIRYNTGDLGTVAEHCSCGRGLPTLRSIEGRQGVELLLPDGRRVSEGGLGMLLFVRDRQDFAGKVRAYQAIQPDPRTLVIQIVPSSAFNPEDAAKLSAYAEQLFGVHVKVEVVSDIAPEASGKRPIIKRLFAS